jgi:hypothetical protein
MEQRRLWEKYNIINADSNTIERQWDLVKV